MPAKIRFPEGVHSPCKSQSNCMLLTYFKRRIKDLKNDKISEVSKSTLTKIKSKPSEVEIKFNDLSCKCQIIRLKDLFPCRKDNIIYFVINNGNPSNDDTLKLIKYNKIEHKQNLNEATNLIV